MRNLRIIQDDELSNESTVEQKINIESSDGLLNKLTTFNNAQFGSVRVYMDENREPWFVASDVCKALDVGNPSQALTRLDDDEKNTIILNEGIPGNPNVAIVSEPGLYALVLSSRKPEAKAFKRWITHEVIPSIRKNGGYIAGQGTLSDEEVIANALIVAQKIIANRDARIAALEEENSAMLPKAEYFDELVERNTLTGIRETAKELKVKQKPFVNFLLENGYCYRDQKDNLQPYMQHVQDGLFVLKECKSKKNKWSGTQIMITPTGRETFRLLKDKMV